MRKPDPPLGTESTRKKRSSAAAIMTSTSYKPPSSSSTTTSAIDAGNDADADTEARSSLDVLPEATPPPLPLPLRGADGHYINPELFPLPASRPGSAAAMYSPGPPTRTTGSTTSGATVVPSSSSSSSLASSATTSIKRKKSRPHIIISDEESDGAEADEEYMGGGGPKGASPWVNVEGRRKALPKRSAATAAVAALEDIRRHSLAF